jgi:energy-coupling factor transporter ATP-binding protein EcfA2
MKRRDLLKTMAALPVGAVSARASAGADTGGLDDTTEPPEEYWNWYSHVLGFDIAPGELTFLAGRRGAGKTSLALEIALGIDKLQARPVWFFTGACRAHATAALLGIELEAVREQAVGLDYHTRVYRCRHEGALLSVIFIDSTESFSADLGELRAAHPYLRRQDAPKLVIYDADRFDFDHVDADWTDLLAADFEARRQDCDETFDAAMLMTVTLTYAEHMLHSDRQPTLEHLRLNARKAMIADQTYFIERPAGDWTMTQELAAITHANRENVIGTKRSSFMLARDSHTGRFRKLNEDESLQALGLGVV